MSSQGWYLFFIAGLRPIPSKVTMLFVLCLLVKVLFQQILTHFIRSLRYCCIIWSWFCRKSYLGPFLKLNLVIFLLLVVNRPRINLPGMIKFSSYKNSLQEFCQKRKAAVPSYKHERTQAGLLGSVSFLNFLYKADVETDNAKDADQRAAFSALKNLGYLPKDSTYIPSTTTITANTGMLCFFVC